MCDLSSQGSRTAAKLDKRQTETHYLMQLAILASSCGDTSNHHCDGLTGLNMRFHKCGAVAEQRWQCDSRVKHIGNMNALCGSSSEFSPQYSAPPLCTVAVLHKRNQAFVFSVFPMFAITAAALPICTLRNHVMQSGPGVCCSKLFLKKIIYLFLSPVNLVHHFREAKAWYKCLDLKPTTDWIKFTLLDKVQFSHYQNQPTSWLFTVHDVESVCFDLQCFFPAVPKHPIPA